MGTIMNSYICIFVKAKLSAKTYLISLFGHRLFVLLFAAELANGKSSNVLKNSKGNESQGYKEGGSGKL